MRTPKRPKSSGRGCAFLFPAIVWLHYGSFLVRRVRNEAEFLSPHGRTPALVDAFSETPPPIPLYVWIDRGKYCVRGAADVGWRGILGRVQRIHYFLFWCPPAESILPYQPLLPAHASRLSLYIGGVRGSRWGNLWYRTRPRAGLVLDGESCLGRLVTRCN